MRFYEKSNKSTPSDGDIFIISSGSGSNWTDYKVTWAQLKSIIKSFSDLTNYYVKSSTYSRQEVSDLLANYVLSSALAAVATSGAYSDLTGTPSIPSKTSDLSNDSGFIDRTVNNLTNYYLSSNTYTKSEVDALIAAISTMTMLVVQTLPTQDISTTTIYLVPKSASQTDNVYDEYIYVNNAWEKIGDTQIDLSNYVTITQLNTTLGNYVTNTLLSTTLADYYTKTDMDSALGDKVDKVAGKGLSSEDYTSTDKTKLAGIAEGATKVEQSVTNGNVKINGAETVVYDDSALVERVEKLESEMPRYGVKGIGQSASALTRLYDAVGLTAQVGTDGSNTSVVNDFDALKPWGRKKCVGSWSMDNGKPKFNITAYYGENGYAEDGTAGDYVAVECPLCYYCMEGDTLIISAFRINEEYEPFDIFKIDNSSTNVLDKVYLPAYALAMKDGKAVSLPGLDNEQGDYAALYNKTRTYRNGALGTYASMQQAAVNFYEWALFTVEFAVQNSQAIMQGCCNLRSADADKCTFVDATMSAMVAEFQSQFFSWFSTNITAANAENILSEWKNYPTYTLYAYKEDPIYYTYILVNDAGRLNADTGVLTILSGDKLYQMPYPDDSGRTERWSQSYADFSISNLTQKIGTFSEWKAAYFAPKVLLNNYNAARVVSEYICISTASTHYDSRYQATHKIVSITRCDSTGAPDASGTYSLIELEDLGKTYFTYDLSGATQYQFAGRPWRTGSCNDVSTPSGSPVNNSSGYYPMKYRWRENVFGNQYKTQVDLFNILVQDESSQNMLEWYFLPDPTQITTPTNIANSAAGQNTLRADPYVKLGVETANANYVSGYVKSKKYDEIYRNIWIPFLTTGGSTSTYFADYASLVSSHLVRSVRFGGYWSLGAYAGFSHAYANFAPSYAYAYFGADLCIIQNKG